MPLRMTDSPESKRRFWRRVGPTGLLGLAWIIAPPLAGIYLLVEIESISQWLLDHRDFGIILYTVIFILSAGVGLLPTYAQAILGGWVFGLWLGYPAALLGFAGASVIGYLIARTVSKDRIIRQVEENVKARAIRDSLIGHGPVKTFFVVTLLRMPPNSPFALTNLIMASTGVALLPYVIGTLIGMAPRTGAAVFLAHMGRQSGANNITEVIEHRGTITIVIGLVLTFIVLGIIGYMANRALERVAGKMPAPAASEAVVTTSTDAEAVEGEQR